jgi:hypothetical protein
VVRLSKRQREEGAEILAISSAMICLVYTLEKMLVAASSQVQ